MLEVVANQEKKCRIGIRHSPSTDRYGFEKIVAFYSCPSLHCHVHLWEGGKKEGGREEPWGGGRKRDVNETWRWMMMRLLYTFLHEGILGAQG